MGANKNKEDKKRDLSVFITDKSHRFKQSQEFFYSRMLTLLRHASITPLFWNTIPYSLYFVKDIIFILHLLYIHTLK